MRLDHISYVASHDQISDVVNRIGSQIGTAFVDGGIHPKFGTRNFTAPLLNGQYIEVVCPLDHPATDATPFGRMVKKKAKEGGGWLTWVVSTEDISKFEVDFGRKAVEGYRKKPDGKVLKWKQLGILELFEDAQLPFYIQWITNEHPSRDGTAFSKLSEIILVGRRNSIWNSPGTFSGEIFGDMKLTFTEPNSDNSGLQQVIFDYKGAKIAID